MKDCRGRPALRSSITATPSPSLLSSAESVSRMDQLESVYLSRNALRPASLAALAALPRLRFLSLIGCGLQRPPRELSAMTTLRACYLDYNSLGSEESDQQVQEDFRWAPAAARLGSLLHV
jgi:hypothetical protein